MNQQQRLKLATNNNGIGETYRKEFSLMLSHYFSPYHSDCTNKPLLSLEIGEVHDMIVFYLTASMPAVETKHHSSYR